MIWCVLRLQRLLLRRESLELRPAFIDRNSGSRIGTLHILRLLSNHGFEKGLILLKVIHGLRNCVKLGRECLKRVIVCPLLLRKPANIFTFEVCELRILLVEFCLGVFELLLQETTNVPSADCSRALKFALTKSEVISPQTCWAVRASRASNDTKKPGIPFVEFGCSDLIWVTLMALRA